MKKKMSRAGLAVVLLATTWLAACAGGENQAATNNKAANSKTNESNAAQQEESKPPVKISITMEGAGFPSPQDDLIKKELDKVLNTDIEMSVLQGLSDYLNQMKVKSATGNMADMLLVDLVTLNDFAQKGLLLDLTPYMDTELKTAKEFMGESLLRKGMVDGKNFAITRIADVPFTSFWIRQDWLDNLNLKMPTNLDELYEVAKAFTENDPDGNNKKDTYGFTGTELETFAPIFGAHAVGVPGTTGGKGMFVVKQDKLSPTLYDPNMPAALSYIHKLVSENLVDPQFMTNKGSMARDQVIQGKAGIIFVGWTDIGKQEFLTQLKTVNPKAEIVQMAPPAGPFGQYDTAYDSEKPSRYFAIPKSLEKTPEKLEKIFELLNYVSTEEGNKLVMYGLPGRHYNEKDGKIELTELMATEGNYFHFYQFTGRPNEEYLKVKFPQEVAYIDFALSLPRLNSIDSAILPPADYNASDADRYMMEELTKFIFDKRPLAEYPDFLDTMETTFKYNLLLDEAQKRAKSLGLVK